MTRDAVVVIPGIMGSELRNDRNEVVWGMKPRVLFRQLLSRDVLARLHLAPGAPDDGIRATALLAFPGYLPLLDGVEPYTDLVAALRRTTPCIPTRCWQFPYDWRRSIAHNARHPRSDGDRPSCGVEGAHPVTARPRPERARAEALAGVPLHGRAHRPLLHRGARAPGDHPPGHHPRHTLRRLRQSGPDSGPRRHPADGPPRRRGAGRSPHLPRCLRPAAPLPVRAGRGAGTSHRHGGGRPGRRPRAVRRRRRGPPHGDRRRQGGRRRRLPHPPDRRGDPAHAASLRIDSGEATFDERLDSEDRRGGDSTVGRDHALPVTFHPAPRSPNGTASSPAPKRRWRSWSPCSPSGSPAPTKATASASAYPTRPGPTCRSTSRWRTWVRPGPVPPDRRRRRAPDRRQDPEAAGRPGRRHLRRPGARPVPRRRQRRWLQPDRGTPHRPGVTSPNRSGCNYPPIGG